MGLTFPTSYMRICDFGNGAPSDNLLFEFLSSAIQMDNYYSGSTYKLSVASNPMDAFVGAYYHFVATCTFTGAGHVYNIYVNNILMKTCVPCPALPPRACARLGSPTPPT